MNRLSFWIAAKLCLLSSTYRDLDRYFREKGYTRTWDGRWENREFAVLPCPRLVPRAVHIYNLATGKHVGASLLEGLDVLEEGIGL